MIHKKEGNLVLSFLCPCRAGKIPVASQALDFDFTIKKTKPAHKERNLCMCGFRLQLRKILVSQLQIVRKQRPQPFFAAGTVPRYRRWTDPKPFSALFAG